MQKIRPLKKNTCPARFAKHVIGHLPGERVVPFQQVGGRRVRGDRRTLRLGGRGRRRGRRVRRRLTPAVTPRHHEEPPPQRRPCRACRPRQDHTRRRPPQVDRNFRVPPDHRGPRHGLRRPGTGAGHHDSRQGRPRAMEGRPRQPGRHPGPRRLRRRGGEGSRPRRRDRAAC